MGNALIFVIWAAAMVGLFLLFRSRHAWRLYRLGAALIAVVLPIAFAFTVYAIIRVPSTDAILLLVAVLFLPVFLGAMMWWNTERADPLDPYEPAPIDSVESYSEYSEALVTFGFRLAATASLGRSRRFVGSMLLVFVRPSDQAAAFIMGPSAPARTMTLAFVSVIATYRAYLLTSHEHSALPSAPGELHQALPGASIPELVAAHEEASRFLKARGFVVGVDSDDSPLDVFRLTWAIGRYWRRHPLQFFLRWLFVDVVFPPMRPLAKQRLIGRRLNELPAL